VAADNKSLSAKDYEDAQKLPAGFEEPTIARPDMIQTDEGIKKADEKAQPKEGQWVKATCKTLYQDVLFYADAKLFIPEGQDVPPNFTPM
jgi:hypothetical protein